MRPVWEARFRADHALSGSWPVRSQLDNFILNVLNHLDESKAQQWNTACVKDAFKAHVHRYERLGTYTSPDKETLDVLVVYLAADSKLERARTSIRNFVADHGRAEHQLFIA
jgi:hypothetical protein